MCTENDLLAELLSLEPETYDPALEISGQDYADAAGISLQCARRKLIKQEKQGRLESRMVRREDGYLMRAWRKT